MNFHYRLKRYARKQKGIICGDPEGLLAVLQITKRVFGEALREGPALTVVQAMDRAILMAAPKDPVRARRYALSVLIRNTTLEKSPLQVLSDAITAQGRVNRFMKKGPSA
jgi:hypothetical protein